LIIADEVGNIVWPVGEGMPQLRRGPMAGDRLPDRITLDWS
jgi:hypothetical protein